MHAGTDPRQAPASRVGTAMTTDQATSSTLGRASPDNDMPGPVLTIRSRSRETKNRYGTVM